MKFLRSKPRGLLKEQKLSQMEIFGKVTLESPKELNNTCSNNKKGNLQKKATMVTKKRSMYKNSKSVRPPFI